MPKNDTEQVTIDNDLLAQVLSELTALKEQQANDKERFEAELESAKAEAAAARRAAMDAFEPQPDASWIDPRTDGPERNIEAKLDIMARQAEENQQPFDRVRTKNILLGITVEEDYPFKYMGHAFSTEEEMDAYKDKVEAERERTVGRYPR